ncbi:PQQ-binding-like beta-propeller repeat protein [Lapillicoccus sp.]|uniref:Vgb family protein n=1 Tax=Lapillicoccus sp. TaxID=1909287 RepID=UPI0025EAB16F|nr:PQQ-binding-like beta-propeller repeat protein [Lapillicoccus sp.]
MTPGGFLDGLVVVGGVLWSSDVTGDRLVRVDAGSGSVLPPVPSPGGPLTLVADGGSVWVAHYNGHDVTRYDGRTAVNTATVQTPSDKPCGLVLLDGKLWVVDQSDGAGAVIDTATVKVVKKIATGAHSGWASAGFKAVWVPDFQGGTGTVVRLDPVNGATTARYAVGGGPLMATPGDGSVWVSDNSDNTVVRLDPASGKVLASIAVPRGPAAILVQPHRVWVTSYEGNALTVIDPATNRVLGTLALPGSAQNMVQTGDHLWIALASGSLVEIAPS